MIHLGNVPASTVLYIPFLTYSGTTGASITCSGLAITDIEIYKNGSVTQRASDAGYTLLDTDGIDFDGVTGLHGFSIDLADNTDAGFFAVGSWYWVVVSAITVDSQTVTFLAATFRVVAAEAIAGKPKVDVDGLLGTAWLTPAVAGTPDVNVKTMASESITSGALATSAAAELAALIETYIINEGDATAVLQAVADKIAADWVAGDASPLAIVAAMLANSTISTALAAAVTAGAQSTAGAASALLAKQILGNKHTVVESPTGTFTISVRNDADNATVRTIVYIPATGARTVS